MNDAHHPLALERGTVIFGYEIVGILGAGGFGITYRAVNPTIDKTVAIKEFFPRDYVTRIGRRVVLRSGTIPGDYETVLKNFIAEARKLTSPRFFHKNIVRGEHFLEENNTAYLVMEFVEGVSLEKWLRKRENRPTEAELKPLFEKIFDAVDHLHRLDSMHRDLTPKNIMVRADGEPVLIDFGLAGDGIDQDRDSEINAANMFFAPPEQLAGDGSQQGRYTDIYSLAGVLYRAVTGKPPLVAWTRAGRSALASVTDRQSYGEAFLAGIDRALQPEPKDRPQSIAEFRAALGWAEGNAPGDRAKTPAADPGCVGSTASETPAPSSPFPSSTMPAPLRRRRAWPAALAASALVGFAVAAAAVPALRDGVTSGSLFSAAFAAIGDQARAVWRWIDPPQVAWTEMPPSAEATLLGRPLADAASVADPESCRAACARDEACVAFSFAGTCRRLASVEGAEPGAAAAWFLRRPLSASAETAIERVRLAESRRIAAKELPGIALTGEAAQATEAASLASCAFQCRATAGCIGVTFEAGSKTCTRFDAVTAREPAAGRASVLIDPDGRMLAALEAREGDALERRRSLKSFPGTALRGQERARDLGLDEPTCRSRCLRDRGCVGFSLKGAECLRLSRVDGIVADPEARAGLDPNLESFRALETDAAVARAGPARPFAGFEISGVPLPDANAPQPGAVGSVPECERACATTESCVGFTHHGPSRLCTLYSGVARLLPDPSRNSGLLSSRLGQTPLSLARAEAAERRARDLNDLPAGCSLAGSSFRVALGAEPSPAQCAHACAGEDRCEGWVFAEADKSCLLITDIRGATSARDVAAGLFDPARNRLAALAQTCAPAISVAATECDRLAAHGADPDRPPGIRAVAFEQIEPGRAIPACRSAIERFPAATRFKVYLARALERDGREADARGLYEDAARAGSPIAKHQLGLMLLQGQGGPRDETEAVRLFRQAVAAGYTPAMTSLASMLLHPANASSASIEEGVRLLNVAADKGNPLAALRLGELHQDGLFMAPDPARATGFFRRALAAYQQEAKDGNPNALFQLAKLYDIGRAGPRDGAKAADHLLQAFRARSRAARAALEGALVDWSPETLRALQQRLAEKGFYFGEIDGRFGRESREALAAFLAAEL